MLLQAHDGYLGRLIVSTTGLQTIRSVNGFVSNRCIAQIPL